MVKNLKALPISLAVLAAGCDGLGCDRYASEFSCPYVIDHAEYEVWYWSDIAEDDEADNKMVGRAEGLRMCENTARAYAAAIGEDFNYRAYICILMKDGKRMEKHRFLEE